MFCKRSIMPPQLLVSCFFSSQKGRGKPPNVIEQRKTVEKSVNIDQSHEGLSASGVKKKSSLLWLKDKRAILS